MINLSTHLNFLKFSLLLIKNITQPVKPVYNQWSTPLRHVVISVLHGLLLFSFCCSSPTPSKNRVVLLKSPSSDEGLVLLEGEFSRPFSCGAAAMDGWAEEKRRKGQTRYNVCWLKDEDLINVIL